MSSWGLKDNVALAGSVTTSTLSGALVGSSTTFIGNVAAGDYLFIGGVKYQVATVTSDTAATLTNSGSANASGVTAYVQAGPKYIANIVATGNAYSAATVYGLDAQEAGVPENRARNLKVPGWVNYTTYTDAHGQTRHKGESLVALSKNFTASSASDASDDTVAADYLIYFSTQTADATVTANAGANLFVVATSTPAGATITYQWQESPNNVTWANLSEGSPYNNVTSNTLYIDDTTGLEDYYYRVVISGNGGADNNTSAVAQVTFS